MNNVLIEKLNVTKEEADIILNEFSWLKSKDKDEAIKDVSEGFVIADRISEVIIKHKKLTDWDIENRDLMNIKKIGIGEVYFSGYCYVQKIADEKYLLVY